MFCTLEIGRIAVKALEKISRWFDMSKLTKITSVQAMVFPVRFCKSSALKKQDRKTLKLLKKAPETNVKCKQTDPHMKAQIHRFIA